MIKKLGYSLLALLSLAIVIRAADEKPTSDAAKPDAEGFITLFDGKTLDGWKANENTDTFKLKDGVLVVKGPRAHLFYTGPVQNHDFKNFHLRVEALTKPKANSGIYFHTKYQDEGWPAQGFEAQVNQTQSDAKKTGGLYGVKDVMNQSPVRDNEWYTYDIIVKDKTVTIQIDGKTTAEWTQPEDWKPPQNMPGRKLGSGTFAIQGHDPESEAHFKSVKVKVLD
jgi:hypothetical protein